MAAKRKITIKRKPKEAVEVKEEVKVEEVKKTEEVEVKDEDVMEEVVKQVKRIQKDEVMWTVWWTAITKPKWRIKFEAQMWAYPMYLVPEDIKRYLKSKGLTTECYKKSKEWLEKRHVDMEIVERLKKFLTERN